MAVKILFFKAKSLSLLMPMDNIKLISAICVEFYHKAKKINKDIFNGLKQTSIFASTNIVM